MQIPKQGLTKEQVLETLRSYKTYDLDWKSGRVWAYVYNPGEETAQMVKEAYNLFLTENGLDPTVFPSMLKLETDIVRMVASLLRGDERVVGHVTSGGTESIILAVLTARDKARLERPEIGTPEIVLPQTAHASFHKAAHYLGLKVVVTPFDTQTYKADVQAMRAAITGNTILLVASAPCYSQGVIDPIGEIGALAQEKGLLFHVDACVGGIHMSFMRKLGYSLPDFDFTVPGVTSISADMHKYGYAAKGASTVLYRDKELRRYQIFASTDTTAYTLINPTVLSSKSGGPLAGSWAILNYLGEDGYVHIVREVQAATERLIEGVNAIDGLRFLGQPDMCMFSFASDVINVYQLADEMKKRGWYLQGQFSTPLSPRNLHVSVNYGTVGKVEALLADLRECVEITKKTPPLDSAFIREAIGQLMANPTPEAFGALAEMAGIRGSELPDEMALINEVLDALPDEVANMLLIDYFNDLYV
ncbi:MAG TPA: aspartate aminotransferase family protein [Anaerolineales bacterium]|nr:aspartate aminotransferase family protein [Anaerolineales bacterium]